MGLNSFQLTFVGVLLSLCLFWFLMAVDKHPDVVEVHSITSPQGMVICGPGPARVYLSSEGDIYFEGKSLQQDELITHLILHEQNFFLDVITIIADPDISNERVVKLSAALKARFDSARVAWKVADT